MRERTGAILPNVSPSNVFDTADGKLLLREQDNLFCYRIRADQQASGEAVRKAASR